MATTSTLRQRQPPVVAKSTLHGDEAQPAHIASKKSSDMSTFTPPSFTVKDLLGAIPKHCFERSAIKSGSYLVGDFAMLAAFAYLATFIDPIFGRRGSVVDGLLGQVLRVVSWSIYTFAAGCVATGVWIIAHECGHQAFSTSKTINNAVGWFCHSLLLVPYHSWRISHARHHAATGSMERDEVFIPKTRSERGIKPESEVIAEKQALLESSNDETLLEKLDELLEDAPIYNFANVVVQQLFGWPAYLIRNASGQNYGRFTNHFDPNSPIFDKRHWQQIVVSDLGLLLVIGALTAWGVSRSFTEVCKYYLFPYLVVNHNLVMITFLQHTDPLLSHYRADEWNFVRGALCTMDRNMFGAVGEYVFHGICETHVLHHLNSRIPHYHAWEATEAIKSVLGDHYMKSESNMYRTLFKNYRECKFVEDEGGVLFYKDAYGNAKRTVVYETDSGVEVN